MLTQGILSQWINDRSHCSSVKSYSRPSHSFNLVEKPQIIGKMAYSWLSPRYSVSATPLRPCSPSASILGLRGSPPGSADELRQSLICSLLLEGFPQIVQTVNLSLLRDGRSLPVLRSLTVDCCRGRQRGCFIDICARSSCPESDE